MGVLLWWMQWELSFDFVEHLSIFPLVGLVNLVGFIFIVLFFPINSLYANCHATISRKAGEKRRYCVSLRSWQRPTTELKRVYYILLEDRDTIMKHMLVSLHLCWAYKRATVCLTHQLKRWYFVIFLQLCMLPKKGQHNPQMHNP